MLTLVACKASPDCDAFLQMLYRRPFVAGFQCVPAERMKTTSMPSQYAVKLDQTSYFLKSPARWWLKLLFRVITLTLPWCQLLVTRLAKHYYLLNSRMSHWFIFSLFTGLHDDLFYYHPQVVRLTYPFETTGLFRQRFQNYSRSSQWRRKYGILWCSTVYGTWL